MPAIEPRNPAYITPPTFVVIASGKGGVGKTFLASAIIDLLDLHGSPPTVVQLDDQARLAKMIGREVITLSIQTLREARVDPSAGTRAFRPLAAAIDRIPSTGKRVVLDIGATQVSTFMTYADLAELDDDLKELGISGCILVPVIAEPEAIRQASLTLRRAHDVVPSLTRVLAENCRDGALADLVPGSDAHALWTKELQPLIKSLPRIQMPAVEGGSWRAFERAHKRPIDVVAMSLPNVMAITASPRAEAKIARGDVASWFAQMEAALAPILGLERSE